MGFVHGYWIIADDDVKDLEFNPGNVKRQIHPQILAPTSARAHQVGAYFLALFSI